MWDVLQWSLGISLIIATLAVMMYLGYRFAPPGLRTIVSNVAGVIGLALPAILQLLSGFDWSKFISNPTTVILIGLFIQIFNIFLRTRTASPVGVQTFAVARTADGEVVHKADGTLKLTRVSVPVHDPNAIQKRSFGDMIRDRNIPEDTHP